MRNLIALVLLLLCSLDLASGPKAPNQASQICCPSTESFRIPLKDITSYYKTSSSCPIKAVVFKMKNGRKICVYPNAPWVNGHMESVDLRSKKPRTVETSMAARTSTGAEPPNRPKAQSTTEKLITTEKSIIPGPLPTADPSSTTEKSTTGTLPIRESSTTAKPTATTKQEPSSRVVPSTKQEPSATTEQSTKEISTSPGPSPTAETSTRQEPLDTRAEPSTIPEPLPRIGPLLRTEPFPSAGPSTMAKAAVVIFCIVIHVVY